MRIKFWGTRGSLPAPHSPAVIESRIRGALEAFASRGSSPGGIPEFLAGLPIHSFGGYGGNTPCLEVRTDKIRVVIDAGSGARALGYDLLQGPCGQGKGEVHMLFTHFHWDHLMGLPFFTPIFIPGNRIHVYAVQPELPEIFKTIFRKPFFPVPLEKLGARIEYHRLEPRKPVRLGDLSFTPYQLDHPDPCWGFRFEHGGKVFSHCVDTECTRVSREALGPDLPLYQGVDLMVFDAQYTLLETIEKINWGHAAASLGLDIAMREGIKRVMFMHYDPAASDEKITAAFEQAKRYFNGQLKAVNQAPGTGGAQIDWSFAQEGSEIEL